MLQNCFVCFEPWLSSLQSCISVVLYMSVQGCKAVQTSLLLMSWQGYSPLMLITSYNEHAQMCHSVWGTEREIRVAATLFQSDILVFSEFGPERKWSRFRPTFHNRHCKLPATASTYTCITQGPKTTMTEWYPG